MLEFDWCGLFGGTPTNKLSKELSLDLSKKRDVPVQARRGDDAEVIPGGY